MSREGKESSGHITSHLQELQAFPHPCRAVDPSQHSPGSTDREIVLHQPCPGCVGGELLRFFDGNPRDPARFEIPNLLQPDVKL